MSPTRKMIDYMMLLFNECDFTRESRNAWLTHMLHRQIEFLDDLTRDEAHRVIDRLKEIRADKK